MINETPDRFLFRFQIVFCSKLKACLEIPEWFTSCLWFWMHILHLRGL